jgi:signal transduction histidine kinase
MDERERAKRLEFLGFTEEDAERLRSIHTMAEEHADELVDKLYEHLLKFEDTRAFFIQPGVLERVKEFQKQYFVRLTEGKTDREYFSNRLQVGDAHQRIELLPQWYLGLYCLYFQLIVEQILKYQGVDRVMEVVPSLRKLIFLDIGLAMDAYIQGGFIDKLRQERRVSEDLREELARKERLAILGQLAGGVGHELRNPLAAMQASLYYLKMALPQDDPKIQRHLGLLEHEANNANEIIGNLLDFSRVRQPGLARIRVAGLIQDVLQRNDLSGIRVDQQTEDIEIVADPIQIRQVLSNLVTNAIQAMPDGGNLRVTARRENGQTHIAVQDTGAGIAPDLLRKIFQPLFTTKAKGIGLGLAVCESLVRAIGGSITVESRVGEGSTFTIHLRDGTAAS